MATRDLGEKLLRLAVHASPSGILIVDAGGEIVFANEALLGMFDYELDELLGQPVEILVPPVDVEVHRRHREKFGARPVPRAMGLRESFGAVRKHGEEFSVEIGLRPTEVEGERMVVATVIDITERRRIEERLRRYDEHLEELIEQRTQELRETQAQKEQVVERLIQSEKLAAIGTLVSGIGHEINNPLYMILGTAEALQDATNVDECRRFGNEIIEHCRKISSTVTNLSQYARPGSVHHTQTVDLNDVVEAAIESAHRTQRSDKVDIVWTRQPVAEVLGKADELQQALFNVIRNAVQACGKHGVIRIGLEERCDSVDVLVRDNGPGIPEAHRSKVFDPFFSTKGPDDGEGLGLYIVRQIVSRHGGDIQVTSGEGTTFTLRFPASPKTDRGETS